nr:unnamed protein product [Callosobruchus chinensis]
MSWRRRLGRTQVERPNRTIVKALSSTAETEGRWDEVLPDVVYGLNSTPNASTRFAPADLMFSHSRSRVANLAGELASDQPSTVVGDGVPRNTANLPRNAVVVPRYTAALEEAYVPGVEIVDRRDSSPKRTLLRPVDDALSQVAGETDQPMANVGDADLDIAGGSNAATMGGQKRVQLSNDSNGTNREVQGDDLAHVSPTAGVRRKKRKLAGVRRWRPKPTRRSKRLLQRTLSTVMAKTSDTTREAVEGDLHKTSTGVIRGQEDHVGRSTHVVGAPSVSGEAHDQTSQLSGRTQLAMDNDVRIEHGETRGQARASGESALSGDALDRSHCATVIRAHGRNIEPA